MLVNIFEENNKKWLMNNKILTPPYQRISGKITLRWMVCVPTQP